MLKNLFLLKLLMIGSLISNGQIIQDITNSKNTTYSVTFNLHLSEFNHDSDTIRVFLSGASKNGTVGIGSNSPWPLPMEDLDFELFDTVGNMIYSLTVPNVIPGDYKYKYGLISTASSTVPNWNYPLPSPFDTLAFTVVDSDVTIYDVTSVEKIDLLKDFNIYPNPSKGIINVVVDRQCQLSIINTVGRVVMSKMVINNEKLDLNSQPPGIYFIKATAESFIKTFRLIVE